ncbi:hypothetical protein CAOG_00359 [Capsaspora owczarzaki ATCC 30864]|uniref:hypothetical protein n=1 Tax=Capsaspora owczarzaki (strain ATCC 30864) TaxID=595528 RepID=UPI000352315D|nr:hypothetical protein CAOG_00359 [Capsaspora owczarzaki ATCC 30864]|eukprot:XP_004365230.2 hypothetical protein CAOG_00359 [Capsaspora owczarzaki ATCC 30864]
MIQTILSVAAIIATVAVFASSIPAVREIERSRTTGATSIVPYVAGIVNCVLWTSYGLLISDPTQIIVNGIGSGLYIYYLTIYFSYTNDAVTARRTTLLGFCYIAAAFTWVGGMSTTRAEVTWNLGIVGALTTILFFAAPLSLLVRIVKTKSTDGLSRPLAWLGCLVCMLWVAYGRNDPFVWQPNALGLLLSLCQVALLFLYPSTSPSNDSSNGQGPMGSSGLHISLGK